MPHLRDFMKNGRDFSLSLPDPETGEPTEVKFFIRRPSSAQQQLATEKGNVTALKIRASYRDIKKPCPSCGAENPEPSEKRAILYDAFGELAREELVEAVIQREIQRAREQAFREVMFSDDVGSKWDGVDEETGEGHDYSQVLSAVRDRLEELRDLQNDIGDDIKIEDDPVLKDLQAIQAEFDAEVDERFAELSKGIRNPYKKMPDDELLAKAVKMSIDNEADLAWFETYRYWLLYFGVRNPEDHSEFYFDQYEEVLDLDTTIRTSLLQFYDEVDQGYENTKASPTPEDSSPSSE